MECRICRHAFYSTTKLAREPQPKRGSCNKTDVLNVSLNVTGRCRVPGIFGGEGRGEEAATEREGRQFESGNIEHRRAGGGGPALFLLVKRKLNHGGHGSREFALPSCNCAANGSSDK